MRKILIPLGIATFLILTGFGVFQVARGKASASHAEDLIIDTDSSVIDLAEIETA